ATIVEGVTKIGRVEFRSHTEQQVENYRKLLLSMARDARVILVKLADRLHNMRTLDALKEEQRRRIALETREIYAPLAHRLGMAAIRWELEDLAFKYLEPEPYEALTKKVRQRRKEREKQVLEMQRPLAEALAEAGVPAELTGRPKHLWSIYHKMESRDLPYEEIYDLMAMRVLTDDVQNCYAALGVIHNEWTPVQERFHDFIATPKSNMYQSLHTTVIGPGGRRYEIQIRSHEMHRTAEYGIAAHWRYKEGITQAERDVEANEVDEALTWFRQVLDWQKDTSEPEEFMEFLRMDLFQGEIFVFTPKGEVKQLPTGATPIDFAYSVHTEIGNHCAGARVNGRISPLSRELKNGDAVEIITDTRQRPSQDWLAFVRTSRARGRIRQWIRKEEHDSALKLGKDLFDREIRKARRGKPTKAQTKEAAQSLGFSEFEQVLTALSRGDVGPTSLIRALYPDEDPHDVVNRTPTKLERIADRIRRSNRAVRIQGMDNLMIRYSRCCQPVPGDRVMGYITQGRGVSIHQVDCPNVLNLSEDRRVEIEWATEKDDRFFVRLSMEGTDRRGLLSDVATAISDTDTDIVQADMRGVERGMLGRFSIEVKDLAHLTKIIKAVSEVKGVVQVDRRDDSEESDLN
ncbi:MAG: bifunctional (p)ppGpp synthetase/guanosine-3',5'-bis(diphosphate) 3'-pyrophosphohydrolase, partial [Gemmatimonadota bacterium]|nr:bifunctional (p)ppGpp synthetase/guanosine-3',5'-bis(diphosphate) 3'-pyrophosphohydrolase [Gemmatimonadota bacterium]